MYLLYISARRRLPHSGTCWTDNIKSLIWFCESANKLEHPKVLNFSIVLMSSHNILVLVWPSNGNKMGFFYYYYRKWIENLLQQLAQVGLNLAQSHAIACHILLFPRAIKGLANIHWTGTALNTQYAVYRPHPGCNEVVRGLNRSLFFQKAWVRSYQSWKFFVSEIRS